MPGMRPGPPIMSSSMWGWGPFMGYPVVYLRPVYGHCGATGVSQMLPNSMSEKQHTDEVSRLTVAMSPRVKVVAQVDGDVMGLAREERVLVSVRRTSNGRVGLLHDHVSQRSAFAGDDCAHEWRYNVHRSSRGRRDRLSSSNRSSRSGRRCS